MSPSSPLAECGFDEPHEPHEFVVSEKGLPLTLACPGLSLAAIEAQARRDALLALRATVEQRDHDYALHNEAISKADEWTEEMLTVYAATVSGVLSAIDHQLGETP